ncbi:Ig-like domain-containing protein [Streptomyces bambusae]|uniref:L,D-transpeptidase n=1 Tax=Streptomyces bambusae TaxID=1550616 RepID=UPI001CFE7C21|nr:Ig-like domain-containing protein [Streptomyces bambusae]MCB5167476.1 Ig-like domain-containing protein [Streptomyces bambusae]
MKKPSRTTTVCLVAGVCAAAAAGALALPDSAGGEAAPVPAVAAPRISFGLPEGTTGVLPSQSASVSVAGGRLDAVTLRPAPDGAGQEGTLSPDGKHWTSGGTLALDTTYTVHAVARDAAGDRVSEDSSFTTLPASDVLRVTTVPAAAKGTPTVGVGMPVSLTFNKPVRDERAVQKAVTVTSSSGQQAVGHWFGRTRLDFRPETYWEPGAKVRVRLALDGVEAAPDAVGIRDRTFGFDVGRSQISTVDAADSTMTVVRSGRLLRELPVSAGSPDHATYNGTMVISAKELTTRMNGSTVGLLDEDGKPAYDIPDVPHAMRLSRSGTFVHGNYWAAEKVFGTVNTSHGCIGLQDVKGGGDPGAPAAWFYRNSLLGDVVVVKDSVGGGTIRPDNGLSDWNLSWSQWKEGSALG